MQPTTDDMLKEIGRWVMETVKLRRTLDDQQSETAKMAVEVGTQRQRYEKLSVTAMEQKENLIALNERLVGRAAPEVDN